MTTEIVGNILVVASFAYLISAIVRMVEVRYKPTPQSEQEKRLAALYGRDTE